MHTASYCKRIKFGCVLHLACISFWWNVPSAKSSASLNAMHIHVCTVCIRIGTFRNMPIQIHSNVLKNYFPPDIEHAKYMYNTFTVFC